MALRLKIIAGCKSVKGVDVYVSKGKGPGTLKFKTGLFSSKILPVVSVDWAHADTRSVGKAAAGAIVGGVLTGGVGAIAGAAIGGRKRDASTAIFRFADGQQLHVAATGKDFETLQRLLY